MSSYGSELQDRILQAGQRDDKYREIVHRLQKNTGAVTSTGDRDADYHRTTDGLVRFRDMIYVPNCSELKNLILREFHAKPYSGHLGYQKTLTMVNKFYYWPNMRKGVVEFVARCLDC